MVHLRDHRLNDVQASVLKSRSSLGRSPWRLAVISLVGLGLLCWLAFFNHLGTLSLMDKTEALFVEVGHQMMLRNDWVTPYWNNELFFDYPVWGYWMVGLSFRIFGVSEWAARLPVALAASSVVLAGFGLLLTIAGPDEASGQRWRRAWLAAAVLALNPGWVGWGRSSVTDMFLASAISLSLFGFFLSYSQQERPWLRRLGYVAMPVFSAIAVLAKGPVGLVLPGLVIVVFLLLQGQLWVVLRQMPMLAMALLFFAVATPWYALAAQAHGMAFLGGFFGFSNLERYTSVLYGHAGPWYFYLPWCLLLLLPWSFYWPLAVARLGYWRLGWRRKQPRASQLAPFCLVWFLVVLLFFSAAATKLAGYILPLVPAGALLISLYWIPLRGSPPRAIGPDWPQRWMGSFNALVLAVMAIAAAFAPRWAATDPAYPDFAQALESSGLPLVLAIVLAVAAVGFFSLLVQKGSPRCFWAPNLLGFAGLLLLVVPGLAPLMQAQRQQPLKDLAVLAGQVSEPNEELLVIGYMRYSVVYYSKQPVSFFDSVQGAREHLRDDDTSRNKTSGSNSSGPSNSGNDNSVNDNSRSPDATSAGSAESAAASTVLLFGEERNLRRFDLDPSSVQAIADRGNHRLWRVNRADLAGRSQP